MAKHATKWQPCILNKKRIWSSSRKTLLSQLFQWWSKQERDWTGMDLHVAVYQNPDFFFKYSSTYSNGFSSPPSPPVYHDFKFNLDFFFLRGKLLVPTRGLKGTLHCTQFLSHVRFDSHGRDFSIVKRLGADIYLWCLDEKDFFFD